MFIGRTEKRVEQARQAAIVAREALDKALAIQQEQEAMLADGVKRLTELQGERTEHAITLCGSRAHGVSECPSRVQSVAECHRRIAEGVVFVSGWTAVHFSVMGPKTPLAITCAAPATPPFFNGDSQQFRSSVSGFSST